MKTKPKPRAMAPARTLIRVNALVAAMKTAKSLPKAKGAKR